MLSKKHLVVVAVLFGQCMLCLLASPVMQKLQRANPKATMASALRSQIQTLRVQPLPYFSEILADVKDNFVINARRPDAKALNPPHASSSLSSKRNDNDRIAFVSQPYDFSAKRSKRIASDINETYDEPISNIDAAENNEITKDDRKQRQLFSSLSDRIFTNLAAKNRFVNLTQSLPQTVISDTNLPIYQFPFVIVNNGSMQSAPGNATINTLKIYGEGTEAKFPPFLEHFVQRIQHYFSVYKYEDLSRPAFSSSTDMGQIIPELLDTEDATPAESPINSDEIETASSEAIVAHETISLADPINGNVDVGKLPVSTKIATPEDYVITERIPIVVSDAVKGDESTSSDINTAAENEVDDTVV